MTIEELIEALEKAEGPSRELDVEICNVLTPLTATYPWEAFHGCVTSLPMKWGRTGNIIEGMKFYIQEAPEVTFLSDAAIALSERVFPGCWYFIGKGKTRSDEPLYGAQILFGTDIMGAGETDVSPAIAIVLAILKAKQVQP